MTSHLRMYKIIFSYRCEMGKIIEIEDCIKATRIIMANTKDQGPNYINSIMNIVRPMSQNTAGVHCNLENQVKSGDSWTKLFGEMKSHNSIDIKMAWVNRIDKNFVKICILVKGSP